MNPQYVAIKFKSGWVLRQAWYSTIMKRYPYCTKIFLGHINESEAKQKIATMNGDFEGYDSDFGRDFNISSK